MERIAIITLLISMPTMLLGAHLFAACELLEAIGWRATRPWPQKDIWPKLGVALGVVGLTASLIACMVGFVVSGLRVLEHVH